MARVRISVSIDEQTWHKIRDTMRSSKFNSKSHLVEQAILRLVGDAK